MKETLRHRIIIIFHINKYLFQLNCCGINSPDDWTINGLPIPATCCAAQELLDDKPVACTKDSPNFHTQGCLNNILVHLKDIAMLLGGVGLGIAFIQVSF